jgi:hypothetical protein
VTKDDKTGKYMFRTLNPEVQGSIPWWPTKDFNNLRSFLKSQPDQGWEKGWKNIFSNHTFASGLYARGFFLLTWQSLTIPFLLLLLPPMV